jgi:hypothetical protein
MEALNKLSGGLIVEPFERKLKPMNAKDCSEIIEFKTPIVQVRFA